MYPEPNPSWSKSLPAHPNVFDGYDVDFIVSGRAGWHFRHSDPPKLRFERCTVDNLSF
jgi:hypothetical protein